MADVHRRQLLTIFAVLVLLKGVDILGRDADLWLVVAWFAAGAFLILGRRWALLCVSALTIVAFASGLHNQHMWLLLWLPFTFLVPDLDRV